MAKRILITGGAGFVGSHLADELLAHGYAVRVLDNLTPQVHGAGGKPGYMSPDIEWVVGDVREASAVAAAMEGIEAVFHLAAAVGVGQSMYQIAHYTSVNCEGTAVLLEAAAKAKLERFIVASSMSIYGEGVYRAADGTHVNGRERSLEQLAARDWEVRDAQGRPLEPVPTHEQKPPALPSVYAITKHQQEQLSLTTGRAYGIPTVALRFFNIYGTRQALSNPYTGVLANFASRLMNGKPPLVMEDGGQRRDFVHVRDVTHACRLALETPEAAGRAFNIGSGTSRSVLEIARAVASALGREELQPELSGDYRKGDIRNCFADISLARTVLGYKPQVRFEEGLREWAEWLRGQSAVDAVGEARQELVSRGLTI